MEVDVAELNELLEDSIEFGTEVAVTVSACQFKCCGGGWQQRDYEGTYTGRVLSIAVDEFLIQCGNEIGKLSEVIARFDHLIGVTPLVD